ncbi:unnamed protein product [Brassica napus]|uniref:(rape) hypothetical protein n=1 Tax=Brassica napus TaxID=3708 RepID=A0A816XXQ2_BRANA|nr:unnamed protein product [Brassica napus]
MYPLDVNYPITSINQLPFPTISAHDLGSPSIDVQSAASIDAAFSSRQLPLARQTDHYSLRLVIAKEPEVKPYEQTFLYWAKEHPLFQIYSRGKLEGRQRRLRLWNLSVKRGNNTAKLIIPNKRVGQGYDPFAPFDKKMSKYPEFKSDEGDLNGLGRRLPTGVFGGVDVDDIYTPVNFRNEHWIAMWISIPKRHIVVWDSIVPHISREDLELFCNKNVKAIREKMALDIVKETPECHSKENEDNDENMGTYDSHG